MEVWVVVKNITDGQFEFQGVFDDKDKATEACIDWSYGMGPAIMNEAIPDDVEEWVGYHYPIVRETIWSDKLIAAFTGTHRSVDDAVDYNDEDFRQKCRNQDRCPESYINRVKVALKVKDSYVVIHSHNDVRDELIKHEIKYTLIYPHISLKDEYIKRYKALRFNPVIIKAMSENWEKMITDLQNDTGGRHIELTSGQYLEDVINEVYPTEKD